ncbi:Na/Pi symporter [Pseudovibrio sp. SPO723]|uniref:Na/Pi cotransporter family protein n=1 Tax=Nesiotobacter zosterae TaxID=392721 RepID=UPI0029C475D0|nr:Na/Pi symporter [Pseudovibrio sp. SPO723]MDX5593295.1 Na/Pi symporter [Pseudovibrio sp. SPO723]
MVLSFLSALGGIGLFLVGMHLLTSGTRLLAGTSIRSALARFTSTPLSGAVTGAVTTATIQSSSATTVAAVGFVASGLLTFPQALGIIFGANIGTTFTGWIVAVLGFKLDLGEVVLPLVFVGALMMLMGKGRLASFGKALAGFSLLFIGIDSMKDGLDAFQGIVTPTDFPQDTLFGRLQLIIIGIVITLVTQSSSAGVATALAALGAGAINFPQAAALVIGMDVGTTFTAALATLGGGTMARRTGFAHVIYNVLTGVMAFFLLVPYAKGVEQIVADGNGQIALVAFHSIFNVLGVVLILPFAKPFARLVEWLVPEKGESLTKALDPLLLREPKTAADQAGAALTQLTQAVADHLAAALEEERTGPTYSRESLLSALDEIRGYLDRINVPPQDPVLAGQTNTQFHALDHLARLLYRCDQRERIKALDEDPRLHRLKGLVAKGASLLAAPDEDRRGADELNHLRSLLRHQRKTQRDNIIARAVSGEISDEDAARHLDGLRWLHRVSYHLWRIKVHLNGLSSPALLAPSASREAELEVEAD